MIVRRASFGLCVLLALTEACTEPPTGFTGDEGVVVRGSSGIARITNERGRRIYFFLAERRDSGAIDWTPCRDDLDTCPHVRPGQTFAVPYSAIVGFHTGDEQAILYWWHLAPGPRGVLEVDRIRSIVFPL